MRAAEINDCRSIRRVAHLVRDNDHVRYAKLCGQGGDIARRLHRSIVGFEDGNNASNMLARAAAQMLEPCFHVHHYVPVILRARDHFTEKATDRGMGAAQSTSSAVADLTHDHELHVVGSANGEFLDQCLGIRGKDDLG